MKVKCSDILMDESFNVSRDPIDPASCDTLAASIRDHGLAHPVVIVPDETGSHLYRLVLGFKRFIAVSVINGEEYIEASLREDLNVIQARLLNFAENKEREDPSFWEECKCLWRIFGDQEGITMTEIAKATGYSRDWVRTRWLVRELPEEVQAQIEAGLLTASMVKTILAQEEDKREEVAKNLQKEVQSGSSVKAAENKLTVRRHLRPKKEVQAAMTKCLEYEFMSEVHALRFAVGEISEEELLRKADEIRRK